LYGRKVAEKNSELKKEKFLQINTDIRNGGFHHGCKGSPSIFHVSSKIFLYVD